MPGPLHFFSLVSVIIMICKSHFGEHFSPQWNCHSVLLGLLLPRDRSGVLCLCDTKEKGLCLATDNNSLHIAIILLFFFSLSTAPGCPNFLVGFWRMEAHFWTRYWLGFFLQKATWRGWELVAAGADSSQRFLCVPLAARMSLQSRAERFGTKKC